MGRGIAHDNMDNLESFKRVFIDAWGSTIIESLFYFKESSLRDLMKLTPLSKAMYS